MQVHASPAGHRCSLCGMQGWPHDHAPSCHWTLDWWREGTHKAPELFLGCSCLCSISTPETGRKSTGTYKPRAAEPMDSKHSSSLIIPVLTSNGCTAPSLWTAIWGGHTPVLSWHQSPWWHRRRRSQWRSCPLCAITVVSGFGQVLW